MNYLLPPVTKNRHSELRTVGFELEYSGIDIQTSADIIMELFGGELDKKSSVTYQIKKTNLGDFTVELDARILKKMAQENYLEPFGIKRESEIVDYVEELINDVAQTIVPLEIIMPPIPIDQIEQLSPLIKKLSAQKAEDTNSSWMNAFGLHINPEVPSLEAETIISQFKVFLLMYEWLVDFIDVDFSRRLTPFIKPFPKAYVTKTVRSDYQPDLKTFMNDYLQDNPTRNRPLDLVPLFIHLDRDLVETFIDTKKSSGRPTYHYRLPNSNLQKKHWNILQEWNAWVLIEKVAADDDLMQHLQQQYFKLRAGNLAVRTKWKDLLDHLINENYKTSNWRNRP